MDNFMAWLVRKQPVHNGQHGGPWSSIQSLLCVDTDSEKPETISEKNHYLQNGTAMLQNPKDISLIHL